ncbi:hypothetical protein [Paenibacillus sp. AGC30]
MTVIFDVIIPKILPGIIISIVTSFITVRLSMKQFYTQKWWERKADTYSKIIEELSYLQYYFSELFDEGIQIKKINSDVHDELRKNFSNSKQQIFKTYASGAFIISDRSTKALEELVRNIEQESSNGDYVGDIDRWYGAVKKCIQILEMRLRKN